MLVSWGTVGTRCVLAVLGENSKSEKLDSAQDPTDNVTTIS